VVSVGLVGDSAGYLAAAIQAAHADDARLADASYRTLQMLSVASGIPLSFTALITGVVLGLTSRWGVFATHGHWPSSA
jgi:H+/Cl- antiporter ClcA